MIKCLRLIRAAEHVNYLVQSEKEEIFIKRHGEIVAILTNPARLGKRNMDEATVRKQLQERFEEYVRLTAEYVETMITALS